MTCQLTPGCENPIEGNTKGCASCNHAQRKALREANKVKVFKPIRKVSKKMASKLSDYNKEAKAFIKGKKCAHPGCKSAAQSVHHKKGREGELLMDKTYWLPLCLWHHIWVTENSRQAIEMGLSEPRNS